MEQLKKIQACTYTIVTMAEGMPNMQMKVSFKAPGRMRTEGGTALAPNAAVSVIDTNKLKLMTLIRASKQCFTFDLTGNTSAPQQAHEFGLFEELRALSASAAQSVGKKQIGGHEAIGYRAIKPGISFVIWTNPDKRRVELVEFTMDNVKGMKGEMSDFVFDANLDDSIFSVDPPKDYTVTDGRSLKMEQPSEEAFIKFLRKGAEETQGDLFLPSLSSGDMMKAARMRKKTVPNLPMSDFLKQNQENTIGLMFAMMMTSANDFHYAGEGVALGDARKAICWYKTDGRAELPRHLRRSERSRDGAKRSSDDRDEVDPGRAAGRRRTTPAYPASRTRTVSVPCANSLSHSPLYGATAEWPGLARSLKRGPTRSMRSVMMPSTGRSCRAFAFSLVSTSR